jgi:GT2 family glycosyltransferase/lipopolysaccharide/colanic/teichoic acid biosynthesis glycosyltransferase
MARKPRRHTVTPLLSIIIVNYNVREFLAHAIESLQKAMKKIRSEIIVVDNDSDDGSVEMVRRRFPTVLLIPNKSNLGFAKANNLALRRARGKFLLLINPDTVVQEDTLRAMLEFFDAHPKAGLAGCKILNPDGSFQLACRRSFPTPWVAFTKIVGLSALFPKSRLFGRYNLTYRNPDETYEVDAVSGSFMMLRREVYEQVGGLDEEFFMYGEDLDWCYRIQQAGWHIFYVPSTTIIHYKGESTKRSSINEIRTFYEAMHLFVRKHLSQSFVFTLLIRLGIIVSARLAQFGEFLRPLRVAFLDFLIVDLNLVIAELIWLGTFFYFPASSYPVVYTVPSLIVISCLYAAGVYTHRRMSISRTMVGVLFGYLIISALVAFFRDYAFSRMVIVISGGLTMMLLPGWRLLLRMSGRSASAGRSSIFGRRTLIVGTDNAAQEVLRRLRNRVSHGYEVLGFVDATQKRVGTAVAGLPIVGSNDNIGKVIQDLRVSDVIFSTQSLSYGEILSVISRAGGHAVNFHIVPNTLEVIIGKASVDSLDDLPLVPISYNIDKPLNRTLKRVFDLAVGGILLISVYPFVYLSHAFSSSTNVPLLLSLPTVFSGKRSLVGPPPGSSTHIHPNGNTEQPIYLGKPGLTGLVQLQAGRTLDAEEVEQCNLYYARNQSILLDIEILLKSIFLSGKDRPVPAGRNETRSTRRGRKGT